MDEDDDERLPGPSRKRHSRPLIAASDEEHSDDGNLPVNGRRKRTRTSQRDPGDLVDQLGSEDDEDDEEYDKSQVVNGGKRNGHAGEEEGDDGVVDSQLEGEEDGEEEEEGDEDGGSDGRAAYRPELTRGDDDYITGSIVRVKLRNFMTYDAVEFRPGPYLNMILGPNGTGKSTVAAAIAIGLGFPPRVMGRAREIEEYVKQGCEVAEVEIEVKGARGQRNHVIWRRFRKENKHSDFKLNGVHASHKAVNQLVAEFGVQANNLCSFLPQDRVAEFSKMDPVTVLKETMRAAGDPRLTRWHEALVDQGAKANEVSTTLTGIRQERDALKTQVDALEPDVRNYESRQEQEQEREVLKLLLKLAEMQLRIDEANKLKTERNQLMEQRDVLEARLQPLKDLQNQLDTLVRKSANAWTACSNELEPHVEDIDTQIRLVKQLEGKGKQTEEELASLKQKVRRREQEIRTLRERIEQAEEILNGPSVNEQARIEAKAQERKDVTLQARDAANQVNAMTRQLDTDQREFQNLKEEIQKFTNKQNELSSVERQRENVARRLDASIGFALDYLRSHAMEFEEEVHKPPMISVNVPDRAYAWQVEQCTNLGQRKTFICQNAADYEKMTSLNGRRIPRPDGSVDESCPKVALYLTMVNVTPETANPPRPCSQEQLVQLGFNGFAIDFVDAPPPVKVYLCQAAKLHQAALTQRQGSEIDDDQVLQAGISQWATRSEMSNSIRSAYGSKAWQTTTAQRREAQAFCMSVDQQAIKQATDEIAARKRRMTELEKPMEQSRTAAAKAREKVNELNVTLDTIKREMHALTAEQNKKEKAHLDKELALRNLKKLERQPSAEEQRRKLAAEKLANARSRIVHLSKMRDRAKFAMTTTTELSKSVMRAVQSKADSEAAHLIRAAQDTHLETLNAEIAEATRRHQEARATAAAARKRGTEALQQVEEEMRAEVDARTTGNEFLGRQEYVDEITVKLADIEAELQLSVGISRDVIDRYDRLSGQLAEREQHVARTEKNLGKLQRELNEVLAKFDPALNDLVDTVSARFSASFDRIGCAGEVRIRRVEGDYSQWGLEIRVSYRDNEQLAVLTQQRQSGGERSLATVTYLMSLSEMARTPFSLVDEINQGMDQRAERNVHNQMVEVTCGTDAGQYFLITPKLLTGLQYHPKMKVLIINNGTRLPEPEDKAQRWGSLKTCLNMYKQVHA